MKRKIRVTIRMGWIEEIDTNTVNGSSMIQRQEKLVAELDKYIPRGGKIDVDVRAER